MYGRYLTSQKIPFKRQCPERACSGWLMVMVTVTQGQQQYRHSVDRIMTYSINLFVHILEYESDSGWILLYNNYSR